MRKFWFMVLIVCALAAPRAWSKSAPLPPIVKKCVNAIMAGKVAPIKDDMTPQVAKLLTDAQMQSVKDQAVTPLGALKSAVVASTQKVKGMTVYIVTMHLAKGDLTSQVAVDKSGKIAGLFVRPATG